jgi:hypothetical protein
MAPSYEFPKTPAAFIFPSPTVVLPFPSGGYLMP